jgi:lycopene cyclase domain-containing protein
MTTYLVLTVIVLAIVGVVCVPVLRRLPPAPIVGSGAALLVLTAIFDSLIVGQGLTVYDPSRILGVSVGRAPIEDFGYTIAAILLMPALWTWLGPRARRGAPGRATPDAPVEQATGDAARGSGGG